MVADISSLNHRIEEKQKREQRRRHKNRRTPFYAFLALVIMITGTLGSYLALSHAATATRRAPLYFQGRITDATYVPLADTTTQNMVFRIHMHATNSDCVWSVGTAAEDDSEETNNCAAVVSDTIAVPVTITRGVFTIPLGDTSYHANMARLRDDFDNQSNEVYYLEIIVENSSGTYETLSPRVRIGSSTYAYNADELDGLSSTSFLRIDGTTTQTAATSGTPTAIAFTGGAHTGLTASTEVTDVNFNLARTVTFATGALTTQRAMAITSPTYAFAGASTLTNAATLAVVGMPIAGTNATLTNTVGLWLQGLTTTTAGQFFKISHPSATTTTGTYIGSYIDLANLASGTASANNYVYSSVINTPSVSNNSANNTFLYGLTIDGFQSGLSRVTQGAAATGTDSWTGLYITAPQQAQTLGTVVSRAIDIQNQISPVSGSRYAITTDTFSGNVGFGDRTPDGNLDIFASGASTSLIITNTGVGDPLINFELVEGSPSFAMGIDNSDSDKFKIGTTALETNTRLTINSSGYIGVGNSSPNALFQIGALNTTRTAPSTDGAWLSVPAATMTDSSTGAGLSAGTQAFSAFGAPTYAASNGGVTVAHASTLYVAGAPTAGAVGGITNSSALRIPTIALNLGVTNAYGLYIDAPTGATNNYAAIFEGAIGTPLVGIGTATPRTALDVDGTMAFGALETVSITANGSSIGPSASTVFLLSTLGDNSYTLGSVTDGVSAQIIMLMIDSTETNTITIRDHSVAASNIQTAGDADRVLGARDVLVLLFDGGEWVEVSYSNN